MFGFFCWQKEVEFRSAKASGAGRAAAPGDQVVGGEGPVWRSNGTGAFFILTHVFKFTSQNIVKEISLLDSVSWVIALDLSHLISTDAYFDWYMYALLFYSGWREEKVAYPQ